MKDISLLLNSLNAAQKKAVTASMGSQLVLAGAGSGKTRVLVYRIAWLIHVKKIEPSSILSVTFTNKTANEMCKRIEELMHSRPTDMWSGTFHSISYRMLRLNHKEAGLTQGFQILDNDDQRRVIKRVINEENIDEQRWPVNQAQTFINNQKNEGIRPQGDVVSTSNIFLVIMNRIYASYEEECKRINTIDFSELLLRTLELFQKNPAILRRYQERFRHILVDEFQDTNSVQYQWLRLLSEKTDSFMVVGDDDQSIYAWRGSKIENIYHYSRNISNLETIRLEQNYRSNASILSAANALIANNNKRIEKKLWTAKNKKESIDLYVAYNEQDEARYITESIRSVLEKNDSISRKDIAVLYRSNAQSRVFEEHLMQERIPYNIYGGKRFFERSEVKDVLSYMVLLDNQDNDSALERIINIPSRGIGNKSIDMIREYANLKGLSIWKAIKRMVEDDILANRVSKNLSKFMNIIEDLIKDLMEKPLNDLVKKIISKSGLAESYRIKKSEKNQNRLDNLEELVSAAYNFSMNEEISLIIDRRISLRAFIDYAYLGFDEEKGEKGDNIQLMTLHSAKGLEFRQVFLVGMEEGLFPHKMALESTSRLEEERRLAYVGITRAMDKLVITYAESRSIHGKETHNKVSRFVKELPEDIIREVRLSNSIIRSFKSKRENRSFTSSEKINTLNSHLKIGSRVLHPALGYGIILGLEGYELSKRAQVKFDTEGVKWLMISYAKLRVIS